MLKNDNVANAAYVGKRFNDYDEFKTAVLRGHNWLSTLAAEYNEAYQSEMKADKDRFKTEFEQLKTAHAERVAALDRSVSRSASYAERMEVRAQRNALNKQYDTDQNVVSARWRSDHPARVRTQVLQRLARPPSPSPKEELPDYSLMNAE